MKNFVFVLIAASVLFLFSCEENDIWEDVMDAGKIQQTMGKIPECVRYVDEAAEDGGDGLSWEAAMPSVEHAIKDIEDFGTTSDECEVWVKGAFENPDEIADLVAENSRIKVFDGFSGAENHRADKMSSTNHSSLRAIGSSGDSIDRFTKESSIIDHNATAAAIENIIPNIDTQAATPLSWGGSTYEYTTQNVMIGTSETPYDWLHIRNPNYTGTHALFSGLRFQPNDTTSSPNRILGFKGTGLVLSGGGDTGSSTQSHVLLNDDGISFNFGTWGSDTTKMTISQSGDLQVDNKTFMVDSSAGRVGIGTLAPQSVVHISAPDGTTNRVRIGPDPNASYVEASSIYLCATSDCSWKTQFYYDEVGDTYWKEQAGREQRDIFKVFSDGGMIYTKRKLRVAGPLQAETMRTSEITVTNTWWADFVFDNDYDLMSLDEVEEYIENNGHLPEIPSAEEIERNGGHSLGDTQVLLLQKIEELTLHLIEQNKRIAQLEKEHGSCGN